MIIEISSIESGARTNQPQESRKQLLPIQAWMAHHNNLLKERKNTILPPDILPYHSPTLAQIIGDDRFQQEIQKNLFSAPKGSFMLDAGAGDGDLSFFLESFGYQVDMIDLPATNFNHMRVAHALKSELNSSVQIYEMDLDHSPQFPRKAYHAVFLLNVLYHLKNPNQLLEALTKISRLCFLTTKVARTVPDKNTRIEHLPLAYLIDEGEIPEDSTNYWVFSETGLRRLFKRTGWETYYYACRENTVDSDPVTRSGDERAFCILRRR